MLAHAGVGVGEPAIPVHAGNKGRGVAPAVKPSRESGGIVALGGDGEWALFPRVAGTGDQHAATAGQGSLL